MAVELPLRNGQSAMEALNRFDRRVAELTEHVQRLQASVSGLTQQVQALELRDSLARAGRFGTGPTVKG